MAPVGVTATAPVDATCGGTAAGAVAKLVVWADHLLPAELVARVRKL